MMGAHGSAAHDDGDDQSVAGVHVTFVEHLCDSVVSGTLSSGHSTDMNKSDRLSGCPRGKEGGPGLQDVRDLAGLFVGYMLMKRQPVPCVKRRLSSLSVSEVQCIVQETLAKHEESELAPASLQLLRWASGESQC